MSDESTTTAAGLAGWRKILATLLPVGVAAVNSAFAGVNIKAPDNYDTTSLIVWGLTLVTTYIPTIVSAVSSAYYVKKNVEQDAVHTETAASVTIAQAKAEAASASSTTETSKKAESVEGGQPAATQQTQAAAEEKQVFYSYADAGSMVSEVESALKAANTLTPVALAYAFRSRVMEFLISNVRPCDRVKQAGELVDMAKELFDKAITDYTGSPAPAWEEYSSIPRLQFRYKQDYEKAHNIPCSNRTMEEINAMLNTMEDFVRYKAGRELIGVTPSESLVWNNIMAGGRDVNSFDVFEYAGSLVPSLPDATATSKKSK